MCIKCIICNDEARQPLETVNTLLANVQGELPEGEERDKFVKMLYEIEVRSKAAKAYLVEWIGRLGTEGNGKLRESPG